MNRRRVPFWLLGAVSLLMGAAVIWWIVAGSENSVVLPDGREVTAAGATYGTNHWYYGGKSWVKAVRRQLSPQRAYQFGLRSHWHVSATPGVVVWTYWRSLGTNRPCLFASVCDRHGIESEPGLAVVSAIIPNKPEALVAWQFYNFPRRQKTFLLRIYQREGTGRPQRFAELEIENPARSDGPDWPVPPLPTTVKQDELAFSLVQLTSGQPVPEQRKRAGIHLAPWTTAEFEVQSNGQPTTDWRVRRLDVTGAIGNAFSVLLNSNQLLGNHLVCGFHEVMWPDESAWKLKAEFSRFRNFSADECWSIKALPLPRPSAVLTTNLEAMIQGVTLVELDLRSYSDAQTMPTLLRRNAEVVLKFTPPGPGYRVELQQAVDDRGRILRHDDGAEYPPGNYVAGFETQRDSRTLDLTFVIRKSRLVEFLARPVFPGSVQPAIK